MKFLKRTIGIIIVMAAIISGLQLKSELAYGATPTISKSTVTLEKGKRKKIKVKNVSARTKVKWRTSNKFAVTVSKKGRIRAVNYGAATITATCKSRTMTCKVTVPDTSKNVVITKYPTTLTEGQTGTVVAKSVNKISYMSSNDSIAKVNKEGIVEALNPGKAEITAKSSQGYSKCTINVLSSDLNNRLYDSNGISIKKVNADGTKVNGFVSQAKGQNFTVMVDGIDESNVKSCKWSVGNSDVVSKLSAVSGSKLKATLKAVNEGKVNITAKVTYKNKNVVTYTNTIYVSNPETEVQNLIVYGTALGNERQQYISFKGLGEHSTITWTNSNKKCATLTTYEKKAAVLGTKPGTGTITANVDGKVFNIKYTVVNPTVNNLKAVIKKGEKVQFPIWGDTGTVPEFTSRNESVATVSSDGVVKGVNSGVTYVDVKIGNIHKSYRIEVYAKGMYKIVNRAMYIVNHWKYSQPKRMRKGYYDCSALVWKGYKSYKRYNRKLGSGSYAKTAASLFDYLKEKNQIVYYGFIDIDDMKPGDLIFYGDYNAAVKYSTPGRTLNIYHVSMYAGAGKVVEKGGQTINYNNISHIVGIGRVVD